MEDITTSILQNVRTSKDKYELINLLEEFEENIFKRDPRDYSSHSPFVASMSKFLITEIKKKGLENDRKATEKFLEILLTAAKALPELKITIAVEPTEDLIVKIKEWTNKNISRETVIDITVKKEIVGGIIIVSPQGQYVNYSLSDQLDNIFTNKRQEISSLL